MADDIISYAVGYARISDKDQSHNSIPHQTDGIIEYCKRNNLQLQQIFVDKGRSAFTFDRPEWKELETYIKKNKEVKYLIVYHLDRFSRANLLDALMKINELENKLNVKVLTVNDPVNLDTNDLGVQILRNIGLLFSNNERQRIKQRTVDGMYKSLSDGRYCSMAPIGYKNSKDQNGRPILQVDSERSAMIRSAFRLYLSGMELEETRQAVRDLGFPLKGKSAIRRILENPVYAGLINVPAYKGNPSRTVHGIHPAIISEVEYWSVQRRLNGKFNVTQKSEDVPLRGVLHCHCGKIMTAGRSRNRHGNYYWYYLCSEHKKNFPAKKLHAMFDEILDHFSMSDEDLANFRSKIEAAIDAHLNNKGGNIMRVKLNLDKVQRKIANVQKKYYEVEDADEKVFKEVMAEQKNEESRLLKELANVNTAAATYKQMLEDVLPGLGDVKTEYNSWPLYRKQLFVTVVFDNSLQFNDGIYRTHYINDLFAHNELILKQKGLLEVIQKASEFDGSPICAPHGSCIEPLEALEQLLRVFVA